MTPMAEHLGDGLSALLDGELTPEQETAARAHLAVCAPCATELDGLRAVRATVRQLPAAEPPFGFVERLARPHHPTGYRRRRRIGMAALAATAAASVGVLLLSSPVNAPVSPQMTRLVESHAASSSSGDPISQLAPAGVPVTFHR